MVHTSSRRILLNIEFRGAPCALSVSSHTCSELQGRVHSEAICSSAYAVFGKCSSLAAFIVVAAVQQRLYVSRHVSSIHELRCCDISHKRRDRRVLSMLAQQFEKLGLEVII